MSFMAKVRRFAFAGLSMTGIGFMILGLVIDGHKQFILGAVMGAVALLMAVSEVLSTRFSIKVETHPENAVNFRHTDWKKERSDIRRRQLLRDTPNVIHGKPRW